jgi:SAM-dependent methyltransferase
MQYSGLDNLEVMREAKNYNKFLLDLILLASKKTSSVVDFGAGNGTFAIPVSDFVGSVICVETDPVLSAGLMREGLQVIGDINLIPDGSVDLLYSLNVLEHIEDDQAMAKLWFKKIKPGGELLVYVPAFQFLFSSMDLKVGHFRRYTATSLSDRLLNAGFIISEARYADSLGILATLIFKVFKRDSGSVDLHLLRLYDRWIFPLSRMFDAICGKFAGKNIYVRAIRREN